MSEPNEGKLYAGSGAVVWDNNGLTLTRDDCVASPNGEHCWHSRQLLLAQPPIDQQQCCWCGAERQLAQLTWKIQHGQYEYGKTVEIEP